MPDEGVNDPPVVPLPIEGELDLHTFRPADLGDLVPEYLRECRSRGLLEVRVVHGKGRGQVLRSVHAILSRLPEVESFALATPAWGGEGATWVKLRPLAPPDPPVPPAAEPPSADARRASDFLPQVYDELRRLAARRLAGESREHTLQPTALVHEAWCRLVGSEDRTWHDRQHFFAAAAEVMRRILVDRARRRQTAKRGNNPERVDLDDLPVVAPEEDDRLLAMNDALDRLAVVDARKAELVKLRYFAGFDFEETAEALGIAVPTAKQWWAYARAWLKVEVSSARSEAPNPGDGGRQP